MADVAKVAKMATVAEVATAEQPVGHTLDHATRRARARAGVLLLILADAAFVAAMVASHAYLRVLNVAGQFRPHDESPPSVLVGFLLTLLVVASAGCYYGAAQRLRTGAQEQFRTGVLMAWLLILVALIGQVVFLLSLRYPQPWHAYASMVLLLSAYHVLHLLITALLGFLLLGRATRQRIVGHEYVVEGAGYWWYYVAGAAVAMWVVLTLVT